MNDIGVYIELKWADWAFFTRSHQKQAGHASYVGNGM